MVDCRSARSCASTRWPSRWRPFGAVNSVAAQVPCDTVSLCRSHLLRGMLFGLLVTDTVEVLAVEFGEPDAVRLVADEQVEDGPHERQAAGLAREAAHHLR